MCESLKSVYRFTYQDHTLFLRSVYRRRRITATLSSLCVRLYRCSWPPAAFLVEGQVLAGVVGAAIEMMHLTVTAILVDGFRVHLPSTSAPPAYDSMNFGLLVLAAPCFAGGAVGEASGPGGVGDTRPIGIRGSDLTRRFLNGRRV